MASLLTIALIGVVLSLRSSGGPSSYTLGDFRLAFAVQYLFWGIGLIAVLHNRRPRADRSAGQADGQPP